MANFSSSTCDEYRVSLRDWIRKHLNKNTFHNFEWLKVDAERSVELFKIPWVDQDKPGFTDLLDICKAWAKNKDGRDSRESPSKLKSRLRDALRNAHFLKKRGDLSCMGQQTGDYVVYQYLSPAEETEKKERLKQKSPSESSTPSVSSVQESCLSHLQTNGYLDEEEFMNLNNLSSTLPAHAINENFGLESHENPNVCQNYSLHPSVLEFDPLATHSPYSFTNGSAEVPSNVAALCNMENVLTHPSEPMSHMPVQNPPAPANFPDTLNLNNLLDIYGVPVDKNLMKCNVILKYDDVTVESIVLDFSNQIWFLPANAQSLDNTVAYNIYALPRQPNESTNLKKILNESKEGFVLGIFPQYDDKEVLQDLCLYGLRKCNSHIYFLNSQTNERSQKMKKNEETCLFSYMGYIFDSYEYKGEKRNTKPKCEVLLALGSNPSSSSGRTFVSLIIEPVNAKSLEKNSDSADSNISLQFSSDPESFGDAMQQLCSRIEANRPSVSFEEMITS